ncbi:hypothetical protein FA95DRAFT_1576051 [Auriscalpium vulgare]|uniref:Uncharacterized protein n=1 Tax=Auriscalpium vulgare TaxID=40419 RepID=A0ACB8RD11_9AGAM|nr:hypothetical protein FA95DRAFT_1576051 [Auriscalpium vulgare]
MHSSTTLAVILLAASAASPALAAPLNVNQAQARELNELMARDPSLLSILKPLGTGLLGGAAVPLLNHFLGGGDSSSTPSTRGIEEDIEDFLSKNFHLPRTAVEARELDELMARDPSLLSILKPLGTGLLGGAAVPLLNHFLGGGDSSSSSTRSIEAREYDELVTRSIVGSLLGATEDSLGTVLKTGAAGGLASGAVAAAGGALEHLFGDSNSSSSKRQTLASIEQQIKDEAAKLRALGPIGREYHEIVARSIVGSLLGATEDSLGTVLKTGAAGGLASGAVAAAGGALEHLFGDKDSSSSKRELEERLGSIGKGLLGTATSLGVSGIASDLLGKLFGNSDSSSRRELEERLNLGPIEKGLLGTVTSLGVSGAASGLLGKLFGTSDSSSSSRRDVTPEQALAAILLSGRSFDELD